MKLHSLDLLEYKHKHMVHNHQYFNKNIVIVSCSSFLVFDH